jgi:hypothetical protein
MSTIDLSAAPVCEDDIVLGSGPIVGAPFHAFAPGSNYWPSFECGGDPNYLPPLRKCPVAVRPMPTIAHDPPVAGSVTALFHSLTGVRPTTRSLVKLRQIFRCTGAVTREQRRKREEMNDAFEAHRDEIMTALESPAVLALVARVLLEGNSYAQRYMIPHDPGPQ